MNSTEEPWALTDDIWRGWAHKSKARAKRTARKRTIYVAILLLAGALGSVLFRAVWN